MTGFFPALSPLLRPKCSHERRQRPGAARERARPGERPFVRLPAAAAADCGFCAPHTLQSHMQQVAGREGEMQGRRESYTGIALQGVEVRDD